MGGDQVASSWSLENCERHGGKGGSRRPTTSPLRRACRAQLMIHIPGAAGLPSLQVMIVGEHRRGGGAVTCSSIRELLLGASGL